MAGEVAELVLKYGGALSGEHGDGLVRSPFQEKMFGPVLYQAFRELKRTFDPRNVLNPGKIVDAPPLAYNLRFGPGYRHAGGADDVRFLRGRRRASGRRNCVPASASAARNARRDMCPSYQATCEEQHSTRGRANTLRLALTGQLGLTGLDRSGRQGGARSVPGMQGVQERVPDQRGHGPAQGGVSASISQEARVAVAQLDLRQRGDAFASGAQADARCRTG